MAAALSRPPPQANTHRRGARGQAQHQEDKEALHVARWRQHWGGPAGWEKRSTPGQQGAVNLSRIASICGAVAI